MLGEGKFSLECVLVLSPSSLAAELVEVILDRLIDWTFLTTVETRDLALPEDRCEPSLVWFDLRDFSLELLPLLDRLLPE